MFGGFLLYRAPHSIVYKKIRIRKQIKDPLVMSTLRNKQNHKNYQERTDMDDGPSAKGEE